MVVCFQKNKIKLMKVAVDNSMYRSKVTLAEKRSI